jgi:hypothetical protein
MHPAPPMKPLIFALIVFLGCTTTATAPQRPQAAAANPEFKNLQIFPKDIPRDELIAAMRSFTRALGVRCNHCHVVTATEPKEVLDFPSDAKEEKRVARVMLQMTQQINGAWMNRVEQAEGHAPAAGGTTEMRVMCWTCHRGKTEPEMPPPPAPPAATPGMM